MMITMMVFSQYVALQCSSEESVLRIVVLTLPCVVLLLWKISSIIASISVGCCSLLVLVLVLILMVIVLVLQLSMCLDDIDGIGPSACDNDE